jgi:hypothetical protein
MAFPIYNTVPPADSGTNAPTRTLDQTQGTAASRAVEDSPIAFTAPGAGAADDDNSSGSNTAAGTAQIINSSFNQPVTPQPNVLDQYASYTYNLGWYLMTPDMYKELSNGPPNVNSWLLIAKSGGADAQTDPRGNGKRSPFFSVDYYIDNLVIEAGLTGSAGGSQMATAGATSFSFQVTEPTGLTLPAALAGAVQDFYKQYNITDSSPAQAFFCMVIQFYGYDSAGNLVQVGRAGNQSGSSSLASPKAIVQKVYPFAIQSFDFKLTTSGVVYNIVGSSPAIYHNLGTMRGVIPAQFECVGATVKDVLVGTGDPSSVVAGSDGREAETTPTVKTAPKPAAEPVGTAASSYLDTGNSDFSLGVGA